MIKDSVLSMLFVFFFAKEQHRAHFNHCPSGDLSSSLLVTRSHLLGMSRLSQRRDEHYRTENSTSFAFRLLYFAELLSIIQIHEGESSQRTATPSDFKFDKVLPV